MIYSKQKPLKAPSYAPHHQTPTAVIPAKAGIQQRNRNLSEKTETPPTVIPANAGIQKRNATGIYRKNPNPNGLDSRLRGNDEILSWGNLLGMIESIGKTTGIHRKKTETPATVIPAKAGIQQHNATGIYRKNPNPNGLDSRLRGNDEILSWGNLSETPQPQKTGRIPHHPPPNPF